MHAVQERNKKVSVSDILSTRAAHTASLRVAWTQVSVMTEGQKWFGDTLGHFWALGEITITYI